MKRQRQRPHRPCLVILGALACVLVMARRAGANGAIPQPAQMLVPKNSAHRLIAGSNFGLLYSEDDGQTWLWVCEGVITQLAQQFGLGAGDRIYARGTSALVYSDDLCTWQVEQGLQLVSDYFPDPSNAQRVLAIGLPSGDGAVRGVYPSMDGGANFQTTPLYTVPQNTLATTIEIARTDPNVVYLTLQSINSPSMPRIVRTGDGGATWTTNDQSALGNATIGILAVDATDANKIFLVERLFDAPDRLIVSTDGGKTVTTLLVLANAGAVDGGSGSEAMTAFFRSSSGTAYVTTTFGRVFRSDMNAANFTLLPGTHYLYGLAERGTDLYAVGDDYKGTFGVGVSHDSGMTFSPLLSFNQICNLAPCTNAQSNCTGAWAALVENFGITAAAQPAGKGCAVPPLINGNGGGGAIGGGVMLGKGGCGCQVGAHAPSIGWATRVLALLIVAGVIGTGWARRHRRKPPGR
jgi:hypothetical protein